MKASLPEDTRILIRIFKRTLKFMLSLFIKWEKGEEI